jgi:small-conductance mechanosensitive channel
VIDLDYPFLGEPVGTWLLALGIAGAVYLVLTVVRRVLLVRLSRLAARTTIVWDDLLVHTLGRTKGVFVLGLSLYAGSSVLTLPARSREALDLGAILVLLLQTGVWASTALRFLIERHQAARLEQDRASAGMVGAFGVLLQVVVWAIVLLLVLDNLGVNITALVAGLGVGGIAVALALQKVLGDLFGSLAIVLDKPFVLGDFIIVGDSMGTVEKIGLRTTRVRSLGGEQLVFSNEDLLASRVRNFGRMHERRVVFTVGVTYGTPRDKLAQIPAILREAVEAQPLTRFDRSHFTSFGASALNFETVYYVLSREYNVYADIQQAINLQVLQRFDADGITFAYPTQTLVLERPPAARGGAG